MHFYISAKNRDNAVFTDINQLNTVGKLRNLELLLIEKTP